MYIGIGLHAHATVQIRTQIVIASLQINKKNSWGAYNIMTAISISAHFYPHYVILPFSYIV